MKYIISILLCLCSQRNEAQVLDSSGITITNTLTHKDSINRKLVDTIYAHRSNYIGYAMSKLYRDVPKFIGFSSPNDMGGRRIGTAYYQHFILFLPCSKNDGQYGFIIEISSNVNINIMDYRARNHFNQDAYVKELLNDAVITSIEKLH